MDKVKSIKDQELNQFPVEKVDWEDAREFIRRLNEKEKEQGWLYRLGMRERFKGKPHLLERNPIAEYHRSRASLYFLRTAPESPCRGFHYHLIS
jgi:hypothetical protein